MKRIHLLLVLAIVGLAVWRGGMELNAQDVAAPPKVEAKPAEAKPAGPTLADLSSAVKASPGCLGVKSVQAEGGQFAIFSWFENKEALLKWYYGDVHQGLISRFFPNAPSIEPLKDIPDNSGPIMVIASVTFNDPKSPDSGKGPFKQISIELYQPLPGGLAIGGRFAPAELKVPGMKSK